MDVSGRSGEMAVFAAIVEQGSLSAAARALGLTPSAVSRIVARIEARLGARLLVRTTRSLSPTTEGEVYLRAARRILADMAEVEGAIADQGAPRGRLRVTASLAHGWLDVVPLLGDFTARHPGILIDLILSDRIIDILGGQADVAIRFGHLADSPLTARKLGETGRVVVAAHQRHVSRRCKKEECPASFRTYSDPRETAVTHAKSLGNSGRLVDGLRSRTRRSARRRGFFAISSAPLQVPDQRPDLRVARKVDKRTNSQLGASLAR